MNLGTLWLCLRLACLHIKNRPKFALLFALNMAIGLSGITLVDGLQNSFLDSSRARSQSIAGADILMSARRSFDPIEITTAQEVLQQDLALSSHRTRMFSMPLPWNTTTNTAATDSPRLAELHFVDAQFPLYGHITLKDGSHFSKTLHQDTALALMMEEAAEQWGLKPGDALKIGEKIYTLGPVITEDTGIAAFSSQLAPRIYLARSTLTATALVQKGSSVWNDHLYTISDPQNLDTLTDQLRKAIPHPSTSIRSHTESTQNSGRLFFYLTHFLSLVGMVAFFLSCIGVHFLFHHLLTRRRKEISTLAALGLSPRQTLFPLLTELLLLSSLAAILAFLTCLTVGHLLPVISSSLAFQSLDFSLRFKDYLILWALACSGALTLAWPAVLQILRQPPGQLFSSTGLALSLPSLFSRYSYAWLPALLLFMGVSMVKAESLKLGGIFFISLTLCALVLWLAARGVQRALPFLTSTSRALPVQLAQLWIQKNTSHWSSSFITLSLAIMLITIIPLLRANLQKTITPSVSPPSLFLLDIQPEQLPQVEDILKQHHLLEHWKSAPFILVELKKVNDEPFTRKHTTSSPLNRQEREREESMRERAMRLSYADSLNPSESIVEGEYFSGPWDPKQRAIPELSLTQRFAQRIGIKLGDVLTFNITGITVSGEVTSMRKVDWLSFEPNFFIQFQPGVVEEAPKTYIGTISHLGGDTKTKNALQTSIIQNMPNISMVDIDGAVRILSALITEISLALWLMALVSMVAGWLIFWCIVQHSLKRRRQNMALLLALGCTHQRLKTSFLIEYFILALSSALCGSALALLVSSVIAVMVLSLDLRLSVLEWLLYPGLFSLLATLLTAVLTIIIAHSILKSPLRQHLSQN